MKSFVRFLEECHILLEARGGKPKYSDEHANINFYNHLVSFPEVRELIRNKDYEAVKQVIAQELENAKNDENHPLHFNNSPDEGFSGKVKTPEHLDTYYAELTRAAPGFLSLVQSNKGRNFASKGWVGRVSGGEHEASKKSWTGNVKGQGRFDYVFSDPDDPRKHHRVSGKDYRGSQAGSAQSDQAAATLERGLEVAVQRQLKAELANKPRKESGESEEEYKERLLRYKLETRERKKDIVSSSKETLNKIKELMASTKGMPPEGQKDVYTQVQSHIDSLEKTVPGVKRAAGQEMLQGMGQFSKGKTAQSMWTTGGEGASFRDPRQQSVVLRARAGKGKSAGKYREMAVAGDIKAAAKEKEAQKQRQTTFAMFSRQAAQSQKALSKADRELEDANDELESSSVPIDPDTKKPVLRQFRKNIEGHMAADPTSRTSKLNMQKRRAAELRVTNAQTNRDNAAASHDANVNAVQQAQQQQAPQETQPQQVQQPQPTQQAPVEQPPAPQEPQQPQPQQPAPQEPQQAAQQSPEDDKKRRRKEALLKRMDTAGRERGIPEYPQ